MLLALGLRLWGLRYGLPYLRHPDEPRYIASALLLFKTGSLDPNTLPDLSISAFVYVINALAYLPYYLAGKVLGPFQVRADLPEPQMLALGIGRIAMPSLVLMGRSVTLLFGVATVWLVYLLGRRLTPDLPTVGWLAASSGHRVADAGTAQPHRDPGCLLGLLERAGPVGGGGDPPDRAHARLSHRWAGGGICGRVQAQRRGRRATAGSWPAFSPRAGAGCRTAASM